MVVRRLEESRTDMTDSILWTEALTKTFGGVRAVDDVDLAIPEGKITSLIGPNGAGKTTLFNVLSGALERTSGRALFRDTDITGLVPEAIARRGVGRSFQITNVFAGLSVLDNVRAAVQARHEGGWNFYRHVDSNRSTVRRPPTSLSTSGSRTCGTNQLTLSRTAISGL